MPYAINPTTGCAPGSPDEVDQVLPAVLELFDDASPVI
jgi:hypothetical protein